ncbi:ER membrane protein complex subunit 7-like protein isoform X2 [Gossypium australe]|uniref:ER membrane protein complex subunit 7-like protein isoform X2 n=1 Tax=Gossypium australe TaxID=47621 RepID=A0A5B6W8L9_9ROSI|nr:ER membrane protein complex subunit 7-like protein isoform X2 [Gossypium australe]
MQKGDELILQVQAQKGMLCPEECPTLNHNIPAGTHLIEVSAIGYFFSPVRVDVSARNPGKVQAALTENRKGLSELVLEPLREEQYYEIREPFSIMSLLKSPMGLMVGFMLAVAFLMPKLVENMGKVLLSLVHKLGRFLEVLACYMS